MNILSSTTQAHSTTTPLSILMHWMPAESVPPVATRSSMRRTLSPGFTASLCRHMPDLLPYSHSYESDSMQLGILP